MISSQAYPKSLSKNQSLARKEKICLKQEAQGKWPDSTMLIRASIISINKVVLLQKKKRESNHDHNHVEKVTEHPISFIYYADNNCYSSLQEKEIASARNCIIEKQNP